MSPDEFAVAAWEAITAALEATHEDQLPDIHEKLCGDAGELGAWYAERYARKQLPARLEVRTANLSDGKAAGL